MQIPASATTRLRALVSNTPYTQVEHGARRAQGHKISHSCLKTHYHQTRPSAPPRSQSLRSTKGLSVSITVIALSDIMAFPLCDSVILHPSLHPLRTLPLS